MRISTFTYDNQDIEVTFLRGKISYIFEYKGNRYGNAVRPKTEKPRDVVDASWNLLINFMETYAKAKRRKN